MKSIIILSIIVLTFVCGCNNLDDGVLRPPQHDHHGHWILSFDGSASGAATVGITSNGFICNGIKLSIGGHLDEFRIDLDGSVDDDGILYAVLLYPSPDSIIYGSLIFADLINGHMKGNFIDGSAAGIYSFDLINVDTLINFNGTWIARKDE